jgi:hypothetical protein
MPELRHPTSAMDQFGRKLPGPLWPQTTGPSWLKTLDQYRPKTDTVRPVDGAGSTLLKEGLNSKPAWRRTPAASTSRASWQPRPGASDTASPASTESLQPRPRGVGYCEPSLSTARRVRPPRDGAGSTKLKAGFNSELAQA